MVHIFADELQELAHQRIKLAQANQPQDPEEGILTLQFARFILAVKSDTFAPTICSAVTNDTPYSAIPCVANGGKESKNALRVLGTSKKSGFGLW